MSRLFLREQRGISLVEVMMVLAVMGFVLAAVYGFYVSQVRSYYTQEDVVDVQRNLRVAMQAITKDIRMAGFLVPSGSNPINTYTNNPSVGPDSITLNATSSIHSYARMTAAGSGTNFVANIDPGDVDDIGVGHTVKVIKTETSQLMGVCSVTAVGASSLTLSGCSASIDATKGDIIARIPSGATAHPNTISYQATTGGSCPAGQTCIGRITNGTTHVLADNMAANALQFSYILDGTGAETNELDLVNPDASNAVSKVRAIRVTLTGETTREVAKMNSVDRQRTLTSIVSIRNR